MKAYWINVQECIGRKEFMSNQFNKLKSFDNNIRINAVTPETVIKYTHSDDLPYKCDISNKIFTDCKNCKLEYCALISHMLAIEKGYNDGDDWFAIFEDDTIIAHEINWNIFFEIIPNDAEVLQLFCSMPTTINKLYEIYKLHNKLWIPWQMIIPSASGYIISRKGAKKMIDLYKKDNNKWRFKDSKSCKLADVITYETCKTYVHTYPLFYPNIELGSLIHPDHLKSHQMGIDAILNIFKDPLKHSFAIKITID